VTENTDPARYERNAKSRMKVYDPGELQMSTAQQHRPESPFWVVHPGGKSKLYTDPHGRFSIVADGNHEIREYLRRGIYSLTNAYIEGEIEVRGDLVAAVTYVLHHNRGGFRSFLLSLAAKLVRFESHLLAGKEQASRDIHFHYDLSNRFYSQFLDSRMLYSAAYFKSPDDSLEKAQEQKLEQICRDVFLRPENRLLDVGCGWGGAICYAAEHFGAQTLGCTLSKEQFVFTQKVIRQRGLEGRVQVRLLDYRELDGSFDTIISVGMFEHVGRGCLSEYFRKINGLLSPDGLFLNRGIVRPRRSADGPETLLMQKRVFPGGELLYLDEVIREADRAGFAALDMRDLRLHYALTCRRWVENLQKKADKCRALVGNAAYRTWLLYIAGSAVHFEDGLLGASQILFSKRCRKRLN
jgi:cyclopropane fatty-acyl-phospholipid synthase-like methyltransferase